MVSADQSYVGLVSSKMAFNRSGVSSTNESSLPCLVMSIDGKFWLMLGNMYHPNNLVSIVRNELFNVQTLTRKVGA